MAEWIFIDGEGAIGVERRKNLPKLRSKGKIDYQAWKAFMRHLENMTIPEGEEKSDWHVFHFPTAYMLERAAYIAKRYQTDFRARIFPGGRLSVWKNSKEDGGGELWVRVEKIKAFMEEKIPLREIERSN